ncbi:MAG: hypothetical protein IKD37_07645 [Clostridia bacterium]|nr:hypothetical protein [Clostridia bacterium]
MAKQKSPPMPPVEPISPIDEAPARNAYYDRVATRYRTAQYLTLFVLIAVLLAGLAVGSDSITYANFVYLLRDFDTVLNASGGDAVETIRYGTAEERQYLGYREGLALIDRRTVSVYNGAGKLTLDHAHGLDDPRAAASAQYLLLYDLDGNTFSLYNSLSQIYTETLDYPISHGTISDSGLFAVTTKTRDYTSAVLLYGKNGKLKNRYLKDKYVLDVALSSDGRRIAIASVESQNGAYLTELQICEPGKDTALATLSLPEVFPLAVRFFSNDSLALLCDGAIYFYNSRGELQAEHAFAAEAPSRLALEGDMAALIFPNNVVGTESRAQLYTADGELCGTYVLSGKAQQVLLTDDAVYLLTEHWLHRILPASGAVATVEYAGGGKAILPADGSVLLCTASSAYRYDARRFRAAQEPPN